MDIKTTAINRANNNSCFRLLAKLCKKVTLSNDKKAVKSVQDKNEEDKSNLNLNSPTKLHPIDTTESSINESHLEGKTILLVDDTEANVIFAKNVFKSKNINLDIAINGKMCIDRLKEEHYDLILMDIEMPIMNGFEATEHIRRELALDTPIIALTTNSSPAVRQRCSEIGMNDFLLKPYKPKDLISVMLKHLQSRPRRVVINKIFDSTADESNMVEEVVSLAGQELSEREFKSRSDRRVEVIRYRKYKGLFETINYKNGKYEFVNIDSFREYCGDDKDFENAIIEQYLKDFPQYLSTLRKSILTKNFSEIKFISHKMKSSVALFGLNETRNQLALLEKYALMKDIDNIISIFQECKISLAKSVIHLSTL
jgi:CheY-like chemotaxis protein/HPt (histidine-containing phosphotransfer) domain-containing protein